MSERDDARRDAARAAARGCCAGARNGDARRVPQVPRAAGGRRAAAVDLDARRRPGEVIGDGGARTPARRARRSRSDADLDRFVRALLARSDDRRAAIRAGPAAVHARAAPGGATGGAACGVERGAVTERKVKEAAKAGARLVLGPGAVLTPLAREKARALGIEIERER